MEKYAMSRYTYEALPQAVHDHTQARGGISATSWRTFYALVTSCKLCLVRGACSGVLVALGHRYWILELHHSLLLDPEMHDMRLSAGGVERLRA